MERLSLNEVDPYPGKSTFDQIPDLLNEEYLAARAFSIFPIIYGERGDFAVTAMTYFRWVDDLIDKNGLSYEGKVKFIKRQEELHMEGLPRNAYEIERRYHSFYDLMGPCVGEIREKATILLGCIKRDFNHQGYKARTYREIRHDNIRTLSTCIEAVAFILNQKPMKPTKKFVNMVDYWATLGSLSDLQEDIERGMLQVPFSREEVEEINSKRNERERKMLALKIYDEERFNKEKQRAIDGLRQNAYSFLQLDMPFWQKVLSTIYIRVREPIKLRREVTYPIRL